MSKIILWLGGRKMTIHLILIAIVSVGMFLKYLLPSECINFFWKIALIYGSVNVLKVVPGIIGDVVLKHRETPKV